LDLIRLVNYIFRSFYLCPQDFHLMPTVADPNNNNSQKILALLFQAEKAGPGSRGGHPWKDDKGKIHYGPQPKGMKPKPDTTGQVMPPQHAATDHQMPSPGKMLSAISTAISTGKTPHGTALTPAAISKLKLMASSIRANLRGAVKKEITAQAANRLPFTVFKDAKGQYRWVGVSSSAAEDHDGETVSLKALQEDVANKDATGTHGPLNWWHTPIVLGKCDFNAMDGPLLVESGTFVNSQVAVAVEKAISDGVFKPAMSLEFEHSEPGPPVLQGRVFQRINKVGRALLPAEKASNLLTNFQVYSLNSALAGKAVEVKDNKKMIPEEKLKLLEQAMPKHLLDALLTGNEVAIKSAEMAGIAFKSMAPAVAEPVAVVAPEPAPAPVEVAPVPAPAPVVNEIAAAPAPAPAPVEDGEVEAEPLDTEALFESLTQSITDRVLAGLATTQATATKEVSDLLALQTVALKDNTAALNKVVAENEALKARLGALEGTQPAAVKARASQQGGVTADQLPDSVKELVSPATKETDPYAKIIADLGLSMAPRG
jgi:hypothetical protein